MRKVQEPFSLTRAASGTGGAHEAISCQLKAMWLMLLCAIVIGGLDRLVPYANPLAVAWAAVYLCTHGRKWNSTELLLCGSILLLILALQSTERFVPRYVLPLAASLAIVGSS
jgi:hypothetical protein